MKDKTILGIIALIISSLTAEPVSLPEGFDWDAAYELAKRHQIIPLLYYGITKSKREVPKEVLRLLRNGMIESVVLDEIQKTEIDRIQRCFTDYGIDFMTLKGIDMKPLYPERALRVMSDMDILIHKNQYQEIITIMTALDFKLFAKNDHEFVWKKSGVIIELHTRLNPPHKKDHFYKFGDGWNLAFPSAPDSHKYLLRKEDYYIFLFTHFTKHYKNGGGIGIRHLVDLWVYQNTYPDMDFYYIQTELSQLHLLDFYENIRDALNVWFGKRVFDDKTEFITKRIFESGSYGSEKSKAVANVIKTNPGNGSAVIKRNKTIFGRIFLPLDQMTRRFPVIKRLSILLPFFWIVRIFNTILFHRDKISRQKEVLSRISIEKIEQYQQELEFVGLK